MLLTQCESKLEMESKDSSIVYKKCHLPNSLVVLKKLQNCENTEARPFVVNKKYAQFRANELLVLRILSLPDLNPITCARSLYDTYFEYQVGKIIVAKEYDPSLDIVSGKGIHYFQSIVAALCFGFVYRDIYDYYNGIWYNYNYNGLLLSTHELKNGVMCGKQIDYQADGSILREKIV